MLMASMRDIKRRRASIQSTQQITKAMKLVSTVKLQKSRAKVEGTEAYFRLMYETIQSVLQRSGNIDHKYLKAGASPKKAVIAITSNRGLAGGYNNNIIRMIAASTVLPKEDTYIYAIGRKGRDGLARRGYNIKSDYSEVINHPLYQDASDITFELLDAFSQNEVGEIYLAYTHFKNTVSHETRLMKLLPVETEAMQSEAGAVDLMMNYEPNEDVVLSAVIPKYMGSLIYGGLLEAAASENGARMTAMDSATNNAQDMIEGLSLQFNRARQGSITQELTEIIAGANAIN